ncbi:MAG: cysteine desulfurase [Myxococcaceae bacterium]|nr:cysteine desulfurase [Myxococcaceae bacterium]MCI0669736.1 cysteine desulfurase [Myxococcaceae bacterium]
MSPPPTVYWDHNAGAPLWPEVRAKLSATLTDPDSLGNASSVHRAGREARRRMEEARGRVARVLGCEPREVTFTGSGSEADALALKGVFPGRAEPARRRVVLSAIEHPALLAAAAQLEAVGAEIVRVQPGTDGRVDAEAVLAHVGAETAVVSLMWANNETGVLQPVAEVARACRRLGVPFHTDAVQVVGKCPATLREVDADLLSLSAHKFGGPPGVGVLVVRRGVRVQALTPGHQEGGLRGGTQNVHAAEALATALELAAAHAARAPELEGRLRERFEREVMARLPGVTVNGGSAPRVPNTSNLCFDGADGEALLIALDLEGICVSTGAACASGSLSPSHVLTAMGLTPARARACLRFSLGPTSTDAEVDRVVDALVRHVPRAREASRLFG